MQVVYVDKTTGQVVAVYQNCDTKKAPANSNRMQVDDAVPVNRNMKWQVDRFVASVNPVQPAPPIDYKAQYAALATDTERITFLATRMGLV